MTLRNIFLGRAVYWAILVVLITILALLGINQQHVKHFVPFQFAVLGLAILVVALIVLLYRPGERITREPLEPEESR